MIYYYILVYIYIYTYLHLLETRVSLDSSSLWVSPALRNRKSTEAQQIRTDCRYGVANTAKSTKLSKQSYRSKAK